MIVDCDRCEVRGDACGDCVITVLLGSPPGGVELDLTERRALDNLADAGLVPGLQLVQRGERDDVESSSAGQDGRRSGECDERSARRVG